MNKKIQFWEEKFHVKIQKYIQTSGYGKRIFLIKLT